MRILVTIVRYKMDIILRQTTIALSLFLLQLCSQTVTATFTL